MRRGLAGLCLAGVLSASQPQLALAQPADAPAAGDATPDGEEAEGAIDVVVSAAPTATDPEDVTPAVFSLGRERLDTPGATLASSLATVPGVQVQRSGGDADVALARVRGGRSAQTPLFLAGIRLDDELTGAIDLSTLPPTMLHRATVYRGHAPRRGDALGIGGAIWLEPRLPRSAEATMTAGAGSFGRRELRSGLTYGGAELAVAAAGGYRRGRGDFTFTDDGGTRFDESDDVERRRLNADHETFDGWSVLRWSGERHRVIAVIHGLRRDAGAPGLQLPGARAARIRLERALGAVAADVVCAEGWCQLHASSSLVQSSYRLQDPRAELGAREGATNQSRGGRQRVRLVLRPLEQLSLGAGFTYYQSSLSVSGRSSRRQLLRPQLDLGWKPHEDVEVTAIGALPCHDLRGALEEPEGGFCSVLAPVGRVGVRYRPHEEVAVFGNAGRYVRVPTLGERFGVSPAVRGNPDLMEERGWSTELGVSSQGGAGDLSWWGQLVGFGIWSDDLIAYRRASVGAVRPYNVGSARSLGLEVAGGVGWRRWIAFELALTALDPRDVTPDRQLDSDLLPFTARWVAVPGLTLRTPSWPKLGLEEARLTSRLRYQASRVADPAGLVALPEQTLWSLGGALSFVGEVEVGIELTNLLDQRTVDFIGYPLPGRAFFLRSAARW